VNIRLNRQKTAGFLDVEIDGTTCASPSTQMNARFRADRGDSRHAGERSGHTVVSTGFIRVQFALGHI
jgi:hypothetical protein